MYRSSCTTHLNTQGRKSAWKMRILVLGAAAGLAVSMPGALAFSASPGLASLHRSPAALPLRSASRGKPQIVVKASLRSEEEHRRARPAVSLPAVLAVHACGMTDRIHKLPASGLAPRKRWLLPRAAAAAAFPRARCASCQLVRGGERLVRTIQQGHEEQGGLHEPGGCRRQRAPCCVALVHSGPRCRARQRLLCRRQRQRPGAYTVE